MNFLTEMEQFLLEPKLACCKHTFTYEYANYVDVILCRGVVQYHVNPIICRYSHK